MTLKTGTKVRYECEGHEPDPGMNAPMGVTVYCNGRCKPTGVVTGPDEDGYVMVRWPNGQVTSEDPEWSELEVLK